MKRIVFLIACMLMAIPSLCFARALPNSEFSLGGICVASGTTMDYVISVYGEPRLVSSTDYVNTYMYGDSVTIKAWHFSGKPERVSEVKVTANNGFATPAGLTVGMKKETMVDLYGYESPVGKDKSTGWTRYIYPHMGSGSGAGMRIEVDRNDVIRSIDVID